MHHSEHDKKAEKNRQKAREELIAQYEIEAAQAAHSEYAFLNVMGQEVPDPTIVEPPIGYIRQPDLMELMRRMIRNELSTVAENSEFETFEDADDFDIDDDPVDYTSPYEEFFDPAPGAPTGPPGQIHPERQDPNQPPPQLKEGDERGGGGAEPPGGQAAPSAS